MIVIVAAERLSGVSASRVPYGKSMKRTTAEATTVRFWIASENLTTFAKGQIKKA